MKTLKKIVLLSAVFLVLVTSCGIPSLHPLYTKKDLILDHHLEGVWISEENSSEESVWKITKVKNNQKNEDSKDDDSDKRYRLEHSQKGETVIFDLFLIKLGDATYLDFFPNEFPDCYDSFFVIYHFLPVHTFAKVSFQKNQITINQFNEKFIKDLIEKNKIRISHEKVDDSILLTAPTEELQKFVMKYTDDENAYVDNPIILKPKV